MNVAITVDTSGHPGGIGIAMRELVSHIAKIKHPHSIKVINYRRAPVPLDTELEQITPVSPTSIIPVSAQIFFQNAFKLPFWLRKNKIDVLHLTTFDPLKGLLILLTPARCKVVVTSHGWLTPFMPSTVMKGYYKLWRFAMFLAKHKIDRYIAVSGSVKETLIKYLRVPEKSIKVVYEAHSDEFGVMDMVIYPYDFILADELDVDLLKIYATVKKGGGNHKLVVFGQKDQYKNSDSVIQKTIKDLGLKDDVISLGYIADRNELKQLYNAADLFIHKVECEGFGLTPLEAMKCGCPVIASNVFSLPEVFGGAAMLINPDNTEEWIESIIRVLTDKGLREEMIERGLKKSKMFSWEETAKKTLKVYDGVYWRKSK